MSLAALFIVPVSVVSFLILLSFIVFFHEYGHFSIARLLGVRVDTFSIGFGKPLLQWIDRKGTQWRIARIPLGGYVKFFGDLNPASQPDPSLANDSDEEQPASGERAVRTEFPTGPQDALAQQLTPEERAQCFHFKPVWARAMVVAAGPIANFILAIAIFAGLLMVLGRGVLDPVVGEVDENSAAAEAGLLAGDRIVQINNRSIDDWRDLAGIIQLSTGETLALTVERDGGTVELTAVPRRQERQDSFGNTVKVGILGVRSTGDIDFRTYGPLQAVATASGEVVDIIRTTIHFLGRLITGKESADQLGGPVKMAKYAGQAASSGFGDRVSDEATFGDRLRISLINWINLAAFISVSIGFLNLLPIPVLDGGHLMYYAYEAVVGRPVGVRVQTMGYQVGLLMLISFMVFVTWNDVTGLLASTFSANG